MDGYDLTYLVSVGGKKGTLYFFESILLFENLASAGCPLCLYKIGCHLSVFQRGALVQAYAIG